MIYFDNVNGNNSAAGGDSVKTNQASKPKKATVVPVGVNNHESKSTEEDKLPQGFYVEKSEDAPSQEPTQAPGDTQKEGLLPSNTTNPDDGKPDTKVHTDERIELSESITIASDEVRPITDALDNAIRRGQNATFGKGSSQDDVDYITKAESMMKHDTFKPLDMKYKKGLHVSGLARYEFNDFKYDTGESALKWTSNSKRIDLKGTYESKSGNTKLFGYLKGATTDNNATLEIPAEDSITESYTGNENSDNGEDIEPIPDLSNIKTTYNEYCGYLGLKQKFNNGNVLYTAGFHDINERMSSNTTQVDALYDLGFADITGSTSIYKIGNGKATVKTNLSCKFKTPDNQQPKQEDLKKEQSVQDENEEQKPQPVKKNDKKWTRKSGLLLEFEGEDDHEQGIGYYWDFKKNAPNSKTKFSVFGKGSTTQRGNDEESSYHLTTGANLQYKEQIDSKTILDLNLDAKNKITFGGADKGTITTAFGTARISSKNKFIAEIEGKLILAKDTYKALALRLAYKLSPKVEISAEGAAVDQKESGIKLRGCTCLGSINVNL